MTNKQILGKVAPMYGSFWFENNQILYEYMILFNGIRSCKWCCALWSFFIQKWMVLVALPKDAKNKGLSRKTNHPTYKSVVYQSPCVLYEAISNNVSFVYPNLVAFAEMFPFDLKVHVIYVKYCTYPKKGQFMAHTKYPDWLWLLWIIWYKLRNK